VKKLVWLLMLCLPFLLLPVAATAAEEVSEEEFAELQTQFEEVSALYHELAAKLAELEAKQEEVKPLPSWAENVKLSGDLRYRFEHINKEGKKSRNRERVRARIALDGKVNDQLGIKIRLASGSDDPVSTNQTLDGAFSSKHIWFDRAYFDWHPNDNVSVWGGKMKNPFHDSGDGLIWDGDLNPEGIALLLEGTGDTHPFLTAAHLWADERKAAADARLVGAQCGIKSGGKNTKVVAGLGYYAYTNVEGEKVLVDVEDGFGNSTIPDSDPNVSDLYYATGFREFEVFADLSTKLGDIPFKLYGDYVTNTDAPTDDRGWLFGAKFGKAKTPGDWEFKYNYRKLEADAVLGAFCDSDFIGGGTDGKGHKFSVAVALAKHTTAGITYFINDAGLTAGKNYRRWQIDFKYKFK